MKTIFKLTIISLIALSFYSCKSDEKKEIENVKKEFTKKVESKKDELVKKVESKKDELVKKVESKKDEVKEVVENVKAKLSDKQPVLVQPSKKQLEEEQKAVENK